MTELSDAEVFGTTAPTGELSDADVFGAPAAPTPEQIPPSFLHRIQQGTRLDKVLGDVWRGMKEGFGTDAVGMSPETHDQFRDLGIFADPERGRGGPIRFANEAMITPTIAALDGLMRGVNAGVHGAGAAFGGLVDTFGGNGDQAEREAVNLGNMLLAESGMGRFSRPHAAGDQVIGTLPKPADFSNGAKVLEPPAEGTIRFYHGGSNAGEGPVWLTPQRDYAEGYARYQTEGGKVFHVDIPKEEAIKHGGYDEINGYPQNFEAPVEYQRQLKETVVEQNLRRMWQEEGLHPAEVVHDAERDAFLKHDVTTKPEPAKIEPAEAEVIAEIEGKPASLGAAVNTEPPLVSPEVQPLSPPGRLSAAVQNAGDTLLDMGRDLQMLVAPMATGTVDSMAIAKDFANSMRRNRWDWARADAEIEKKFTPEQRRRMWNAADEDSVSLQLNEPAHMREHQGLATLEPAERAAVEEMQTRAQNAWLRARDLGMVEGEGLPAYTPRMVINTAAAVSGDKALSLNGIGNNLSTKTANLRQRKYLEASETEAAAKAKYGEEAEIARDIRTLPLATSKLEDAIAGRTLINNIKEIGKRTGEDTVAEGGIPKGSEHKWFTIDHPSFRTWKPKLEEIDGKMVPVKDAKGEIVFQQEPIYIRDDFEGPLRAVLTQESGPLYNAVMSLKGKTMSMIMNSPMIHNAVEWGRAMPAMPGKVLTFKVYFEGNRAKNNVPLMREAIDNGLVPIGHRFFNQDITSMMEQPNLAPGRSFTAQVLGFVPGLFDEAAGASVKTAIDKAGNFWHNTLLWDRVADLQMGLYTNFRTDLMAKGVDQQTASRAAAHWANRYAGALPQEAMSDAARKVANVMMFSRSFTLGNLGVMKDMLNGLPRDVMAQITRDVGQLDPKAKGYIKSMATRKAISVVLADVVLMYVGNSLLQSGVNVLMGDHTLDEEMHGYAVRMAEQLQAVKEHPLKLLQPLHLMENLSSTSENEPGKADRVKIGYAKDGTAIYMRNPVGKIGEEFVGYMSGPLDMMRRKLGTVARPAWQIMNNDAGFGRKVYDPAADTPAKYMQNIGLIASHLARSQFPEGQMNATMDMVKGEGDAKVNQLQAIGPFVGTTFSKGAPGGPAVGEMYAARQKHDYAVQAQMPDIRRQILRGDMEGAQKRMDALAIPTSYQRWITKTTLNPATRLGTRTLRDFYQYATPEQKARMERAQQAPAQP